MTTLPSSNLTINTIHQATGGSSGTQVSLEDNEVRVLADNDASGTAISFNALRGKIGIPKTNSTPSWKLTFIGRTTYYFWNRGTDNFNQTRPSATWSGVPKLVSCTGSDAGTVIVGKDTTNSPASVQVEFGPNDFHAGWTTITHSSTSGSIKRTGTFTFSGIDFPTFPNPTVQGSGVNYSVEASSFDINDTYSSSGLPEIDGSGPFPSYNFSIS